MGLFVGLGGFYWQIKPKILLCYPGFFRFEDKVKWSLMVLSGQTPRAEPPTLQLQGCKVVSKWSFSLKKSSWYYCSFQFRCCKKKSVGFRQHGHNQPDGFDEALAFLIIILISLFHSEPDLKHLREAFQSSLPRPDGLQHKHWWWMLCFICCLQLVLTILAAFPRCSSKQRLLFLVAILFLSILM